LLLNYPQTERVEEAVVGAPVVAAGGPARSQGYGCSVANLQEDQLRLNDSEQEEGRVDEVGLGLAEGRREGFHFGALSISLELDDKHLQEPPHSDLRHKYPTNVFDEANGLPNRLFHILSCWQEIS